MTAESTSKRFATGSFDWRGWPRPGGMPSVFTAFVRSLQGEETPDADLFHDAWRQLQATLAKEMRKRGLWQSPPCYLGIFGAERWGAEEPDADPMARTSDGTGGQVGALGELVADCYAFIFVDRLQSLKRQLAAKPDIDGLVLLNVRHFLHERQKEHDPLGYQVFEALRATVRDAVATGRLHVLAGDERVRNDTLLGFASAATPPPATMDLSSLVERWNDTLFVELLGRRVGRQPGVHERLLEHLLALPDQGVQAFRFKSLVDPLKHDARRRWTALLAGAALDEDGRLPAAEASCHARAESRIESRQSFQFLTRCVAAAIRRIEADPRTRTYLAALWQFLSLQHAADDEAPASAEMPAAHLVGDEPLSHRQLGKQLHIPRERLPLLFTILRQLTARCWAAAMARLDRPALPSTRREARRDPLPATRLPAILR